MQGVLVAGRGPGSGPPRSPRGVQMTTAAPAQASGPRRWLRRRPRTCRARSSPSSSTLRLGGRWRLLGTRWGTGPRHTPPRLPPRAAVTGEDTNAQAPAAACSLPIPALRVCSLRLSTDLQLFLLQTGLSSLAPPSLSPTAPPPQLCLLGTPGPSTSLCLHGHHPGPDTIFSHLGHSNSRLANGAAHCPLQSSKSINMICKFNHVAPL